MMLVLDNNFKNVHIAKCAFFILGFNMNIEEAK